MAPTQLRLPAPRSDVADERSGRPGQGRRGADPVALAAAIDDAGRPAPARTAPLPAPEPVPPVAPVVSASLHPQVSAGPWVRRLATLAVVLVALVAAVASYDHQRQLAALAGEGWRAWLLPLSVDGLMVAASMCLLVRRNAGQSARLAWVSLIAGGGVSIVANVAAAEPTLVGRVVAGWPPVALILAYELLMQIRGGGAGVQTVRPHLAPTPREVVGDG
jgi:hypothetical protein